MGDDSTPNTGYAKEEPVKFGTMKKLERLIYVHPLHKLDFKIETNEEVFEPGQKAIITVKLPIQPSGKLESYEKYFAQVIVTDVSSYLQVPKHKWAPSLPSMVYLEKEIKQDDEQIDEFLYSREYIDYDFYTSQARSSQESDSIVAPELYDDKKHREKKLDILLASQSWRKGLLDDTKKF